MFSTMAESRPFQSLYSCKGGRDENETISPDFKNGGLKNVDINKKIASLQCSWIKRLYDDSFHEWKLIPLKLIKKSFGDELKFHSNLSFNNSYVRIFPCFVEGVALARVFCSVGFARFLGASCLQSPLGWLVPSVSSLISCKFIN